MRQALITGGTGQDAAYLARFLLAAGYVVHAVYRRTSNLNLWRLRELNLLGHDCLHLVEGELSDPASLIRLLHACKPDEIYNLAAQSFVGASFDQPVSAFQSNAIGTLNLLEAVRSVGGSVKLYQASSAELFGKVQSVPQNETTPFYPRSPYGIAKLAAHWLAVNYREAYGLFTCSGILFNHESPLRGADFVTRRISLGAAAAARADGPPLFLGNLSSCRDWGYAGDFVEGMWRMLQNDVPEDFVLATGRTAAVRDFATMAFETAGFDLVWCGEGADEIGIDRRSGRVLVCVDPAHYRPAEVQELLGDSGKARLKLGWAAVTSLETLCRMMVEADMRRAGIDKAGGAADPADFPPLGVVGASKATAEARAPH